jgi:hypothetical protein
MVTPFALNALLLIPLLLVSPSGRSERAQSCKHDQDKSDSDNPRKQP